LIPKIRAIEKPKSFHLLHLYCSKKQKELNGDVLSIPFSSLRVIQTEKNTKIQVYDAKQKGIKTSHIYKNILLFQKINTSINYDSKPYNVNQITPLYFQQP
jgi:hypothetical protein